MLILLPPSEGKAPAGTGPAVDPASLVFPELARTRKAVLKALTTLAKRPVATTLDVLGLSPNQAAEIVANAQLATAPTLPAADRYTGVLYDALDLPGLRHNDPGAYARAEASLLTFSGLWGVVRPSDAIPALEPAAGHGLVVDLRSSAYTPMWRVPAHLADMTVSVRVLHERVVGGVPKRTVVSHFNKATKGRLARALLVADVTATTPKELAEACEQLGFRVELAAPGRPGAPWTADVVVDSVV